MVRHFGLLTTVALIAGTLLVFAPSGPAYAGSGCNSLDAQIGQCSSGAVANSVGDAISIQKRITRIDRGAADHESPRSRRAAHVLSASEIQALVDDQCYGSGHCSTGTSNGLNSLILPTEPVDPAPAADAETARVVTIADVERFVPAVAQLHAEPDGWAVVGVPSNFWTVVGPVVVDGDLLGEAAQVRFSPQLYRWDYGDGTGRTTRTSGANWFDLAQQELTATATSHVYAEKTTVEATVAVIWSAEYRIADGDWIPVAGAVSSTAPGADLLVVRERTVLTAG